MTCKLILKVISKIVVKYLYLYKFLLVEENDKIMEFGDILKTPFSLSLYMFQQLKCQWLKTGQFFLSSVTYNLAWDPQGI